MKLSRHPMLDALCAEYLVGTLRGAARRRFERALRDEPLVAARLQQLIDRYVPTPSGQTAVTPRADGWQRLQRELKLPGSRQPPWYSMLAPWQWATAAVAVIALGIALAWIIPPGEPPTTQLAQLSGDNRPAVTVVASLDRQNLQLSSVQPAQAQAGSSYELWLLPAEGGAPVSLGVLARLEGRITVAAALASRLRAGAKLAISVEPSGGSPTGAPTGPVILAGAIS